MKESIRRIGLIKTVVDRGFSAVGPSLDPADAQARALMLAACRAVATANAAMVLVRHNHAHETLPLVRSLLEFAACARRIAGAGGAPAAEEFLAEARRPCWEGLWSGGRVTAAGMPAELVERVGEWCGAFLGGNAQGLPWAHVFSGPEPVGVSAEEALAAAARCMEELAKALDARWPGAFSLDGLQER